MPQRDLLCGLCLPYCWGWAMFAFSPVGCIGPLWLFRTVSVLVLWRGCLGRLGFVVGQCQQSDHPPALSLSTEAAVVPTCRVSSLPCSLGGFHWWVRLGVRPRAYLQSLCSSCSHTKLQDSCCVQPPEKFLLLSWASSQVRCLPQTFCCGCNCTDRHNTCSVLPPIKLGCWDCGHTGVCGYLPLPLGQQSHWSGCGPCQGGLQCVWG